MPPLEAAVMQGVLLADDKSLGEEDSTNLDRAGLGRFLSVTGFHVTMVSRMVGLARDGVQEPYALVSVQS